VLILENPALRGQSKTTTSLYAGIQLVMPCEALPPHCQSALRFVLESCARTSSAGSGDMTTSFGAATGLFPIHEPP
jgi:gentisate 1,2-dioxygenase